MAYRIYFPFRKRLVFTYQPRREYWCYQFADHWSNTSHDIVYIYIITITYGNDNKKSKKSYNYGPFAKVTIVYKWRLSFVHIILNSPLDPLLSPRSCFARPGTPTLEKRGVRSERNLSNPLWSLVITPVMVLPLARTWFGRRGQEDEGTKIHFMTSCALYRILIATFANASYFNDFFNEIRAICGNILKRNSPDAI